MQKGAKGKASICGLLPPDEDLPPLLHRGLVEETAEYQTMGRMEDPGKGLTRSDILHHPSSGGETHRKLLCSRIWRARVGRVGEALVGRNGRTCSSAIPGTLLFETIVPLFTVWNQGPNAALALTALFVLAHIASRFAFLTKTQPQMTRPERLKRSFQYVFTNPDVAIMTGVTFVAAILVGDTSLFGLNSQAKDLIIWLATAIHAIINTRRNRNALVAFVGNAAHALRGASFVPEAAAAEYIGDPSLQPVQSQADEIRNKLIGENPTSGSA